MSLLPHPTGPPPRVLPQSTFLPRSRGSPRAQLLQRIRFGGAAAREDFFPTPAGPRSCLGTSRRVHAHHALARQPSASAARRGGARPGPCWASDARGPAPHPTCQLVGAQAAAVPSRPAPRKTRSGGRSRLPRGGAARRGGLGMRNAQGRLPAPKGSVLRDRSGCAGVCGTGSRGCCTPRCPAPCAPSSAPAGRSRSDSVGKRPERPGPRGPRGHRGCAVCCCKVVIQHLAPPPPPPPPLTLPVRPAGCVDVRAEAAPGTGKGRAWRGGRTGTVPGDCWADATSVGGLGAVRGSPAAPRAAHSGCPL